ncbi:PREDICTED: multiple inositol polyphosphate phosphatase 1-like isoform X2 [Dinoponera quadriceps]|uniref:Multiple inositol polyphosphate phosphatase 1 n=1 Tax=Dinoponera quadriceps TaxID=609295 RepID=A0A6P3X010_DINQU|nr:PREDICTED: multiple inositol polyphosphate phosphatase 1-like isoform X2 [Dinoponera quadriceps]
MGSSKMHRQLLCCFLLVCLTTDAVSKEDESCYADNRNPYIYTGTTTAYHFVSNNVTERINVPNCKPIYIWMYCRHGTRYANRNRMLSMLNLTYMQDLIVGNHEIMKQRHLCDQDLQNLKNWSPDRGLIARNHKHLTSQGERDLSTLGERFRARYPELFDANKPENYKFRSTNTQRTISSMTSFISGAFGDDFVADMEIDGLMNDSVMIKMISNCRPWLDEMNSTGGIEKLREFIDGPEMAEVVTDVNRRLGFAGRINKDDVFLLYDACRFEKAWQPDRLSPWCAVFDDDDMRVLEYEQDLFHYYHSGYGLKINRQFGCHTVRDMVDRFAPCSILQETGARGGGRGHRQTEGLVYFCALGRGGAVLHGVGHCEGRRTSYGLELQGHGPQEMEDVPVDAVRHQLRGRLP